MKNVNVEHREGQSLTEFALVLPVLLLVIMGMFDLGFAVYASNTVALSAREGARLGVIRTKTDAQICQRVTDTSVALTVNCTVNPSPTRSLGHPFTVTVTTNFTPVTPLIGRIIGSGHLTFIGQSSMVAE